MDEIKTEESKIEEPGDWRLRSDVKHLPVKLSDDDIKMLTEAVLVSWKYECQRLELKSNYFSRSVAWSFELEHIRKLANFLDWLCDVRRTQEEKRNEESVY